MEKYANKWSINGLHQASEGQTESAYLNRSKILLKKIYIKKEQAKEKEHVTQ